MTGPGMARAVRLNALQVRAIVSEEIAGLREMVTLLQERLDCVEACVEAANAPASMSSSVMPSQVDLRCAGQAAALDNVLEKTAGCSQVATDDGEHIAPTITDIQVDAQVNQVDGCGKGGVEKEEVRAWRRSGRRSDTDQGSDHWDFEEDAYTLGMLALATKGLSGARVPLALAFLPFLLQLLCFFAVFDFMVKETIEIEFGGVRLLASFACFFLMGLQLTNEMLEGFHKMVFSWRCVSGMYQGVRQPSCIIGVLLGFVQLSMPCWIVGLSMQLVLGADSVLDAFMNYVALIFITEIDNSLIANRVVRHFFVTSSDIHVQYAVDESAASKDKELWTVGMMFFSFFLILFSQIFGVVCVAIADVEGNRVRDLEWWLEQLPAFVVLLVVLNLVMRFGSRQAGAVPVALALAVLIFTYFLISNILFPFHINLIQPLATMTLFVFGIICVPLAAATAADPFAVLHCPYRLPAICWLFLLAGMMWTGHMHKFHQRTQR